MLLLLAAPACKPPAQATEAPLTSDTARQRAAELERLLAKDPADDGAALELAHLQWLHLRSAAKEAGPLPTSATFLPVVGFFAGNSADNGAFSNVASVAKRWSRPMAIGSRPHALYTHAPAQSSSTGHTREHDAPRMFSARIVRAAPFVFSVAIL